MTQAAPVVVPGFTGTLLTPGDAEYDAARTVFNGMIDRRPAVIARCTSTADVVAAVKYARAQGLDISVYGGGHGVTGSAVIDAAMCIDLRGLKTAEVDPVAKTIHAGGGLTWGELDAATQAHNLAVTGGRVSTTGVGGLSLGSGSGWLERKFGFVCDNLLAAELVTADGRIVTASETENTDLFWALRGGGGNFGIVTTFTFQLHDLGPIVYGGMLVFPAQRGVEVMRAYRDFVASAPDEVGSGLAFITAPHEEFVPEPARGHPAIGIICCYAGAPEDGAAAYAPLLELGPAMAMVQPMPYVAVQQIIDAGNAKGRINYWTGDFYDEFPDEAIDVLVGIATQPVSPFTQIIVVPGGGAISRLGDDEMALGSRKAAFNFHFLSAWEDPNETQRNIDYTRRLAGALKPWSTGAAYLNFLGDEGQARIEASFGAAKWARLRQIKGKWDPENVFRHNQNIPPAPTVIPDQR
ncbi:MAG TPA: FAD-binding oxidoreductase [Mycobacteriales bacterium]|jgi:FAD/FMN-containing dehydrogenase|nr:FAD-binding oxidoreductase [Mycobacteriales bacterium]